MESPAVFGVLALLSAPFITLLFIRLKRNQDENAALITAKFDGRRVLLQDPVAYLVAQQSSGLRQRQGNGNLILTEDELLFAMNLPRTVISIPAQSLGETERVSRMCATGRLGKFLKVSYRDDQGQEDALGLNVKEMERWEAEIRRVRSRTTSQSDPGQASG